MSVYEPIMKGQKEAFVSEWIMLKKKGERL